MLHLISQFLDQTKLTNYQAYLSPNDIIIAIGEGVYCLVTNTIANNNNIKPISIYALKTDIQARGLTEKLNIPIHLIDYPQFIELTAEHYPILNW